MAESAQPACGKVYLVGAGPGDPGLISVRGIELLERADAVVYDYLVNPAILEYAPANAQRLCLGRHGSGRVMTQAEVNEAVVELARQQPHVVRLKGGDPMIFGRFSEEAAALQQAGIPFEIVPGVTAALAASSCAAAPLTHREHASAVAFVTGQEGPEKDEPGLDFAALAQFPGTLVFYMGVTTAERWVSQLLTHGKRPDTPCTLVRRASCVDQQRWTCNLAEVPQTISREKIRPPVVAIVGAASQTDDQLNWFARRSLFGRSVLITRPLDQSRLLAHTLREYGADVGIQPAIDIGPPADWSPVDSALRRLSEFDWIVFSSTNGVDYCLDRLREIGLDWRALGGVKIAAVGPVTASRLAARDLDTDLVPAVYQADVLGDELASCAAGQRFLLIRASRGREVLAEKISAANGSVEQVVVYRSEDAPAVDEEKCNEVREGRWEFITVTSPAIGRALAKQYGAGLGGANLVSISPVTTQALVEVGHPPAITAAEATMDGVIAALLKLASD